MSGRVKDNELLMNHTRQLGNVDQPYVASPMQMGRSEVMKYYSIIADFIFCKIPSGTAYRDK